MRSYSCGMLPASDFNWNCKLPPMDRATASVPCGYLDVFATGFGFAPDAKRLMVEKDHQFLAISLEAFPMIEY